MAPAERSDHADADAGGALTSLHVRRATDGDANSLGWLVDRLAPLLLAQARYRLGPSLCARHEPADVVQDAWLTLLPRLHTLEVPAEHGTPVLLRFLSATIVNIVRNLIRSRLRRQTSAEPPRSSLAAAHTGVVSAALRAERRDHVTAALHELSDSDREVVILRGIEQLSNTAAAAILGIEPTAVSTRYRRALARLRERLPDSILTELTS